ncbi:hypothetical protein D3C75_1077280 [compost metagenome]
MTAFAQLCLSSGPLFTERQGVGVECQATTNDLLARLWRGQAIEHHIQTEAVEQLRTQLAFFGVHGANQNETGTVAVGNAVTLYTVGAAGSHIEQKIDQGVG